MEVSTRILLCRVRTGGIRLGKICCGSYALTPGDATLLSARREQLPSLERQFLLAVPVVPPREGQLPLQRRAGLAWERAGGSARLR